MQVTALYAYEPEESDELRFQRGDVLRVLHVQEDGWWSGYRVKKPEVVGLFPSNYVQEQRSISPPISKKPTVPKTMTRHGDSVRQRIQQQPQRPVEPPESDEEQGEETEEEAELEPRSAIRGRIASVLQLRKDLDDAERASVAARDARVQCRSVQAEREELRRRQKWRDEREQQEDDEEESEGDRGASRWDSRPQHLEDEKKDGIEPDADEADEDEAVAVVPQPRGFLHQSADPEELRGSASQQDGIVQKEPPQPEEEERDDSSLDQQPDTAAIEEAAATRIARGYRRHALQRAAREVELKRQRKEQRAEERRRQQQEEAEEERRRQQQEEAEEERRRQQEAEAEAERLESERALRLESKQAESPSKPRRKVMKTEAVELIKTLVQQQLDEALQEHDAKITDLQRIVTTLQNVVRKQTAMLQASTDQILDLQAAQHAKKAPISPGKRGAHSDCLLPRITSHTSIPRQPAAPSGLRAPRPEFAEHVVMVSTEGIGLALASFRVPELILHATGRHLLPAIMARGTGRRKKRRVATASEAAVDEETARSAFLAALEAQRAKARRQQQEQRPNEANPAPEPKRPPPAELPGFYYDEAKARYFPCSSASERRRRELADAQQQRERNEQTAAAAVSRSRGRRGRMSVIHNWVPYMARRQSDFAWSAHGRDRLGLVPQLLSGFLVVDAQNMSTDGRLTALALHPRASNLGAMGCSGGRLEILGMERLPPRTISTTSSQRVVPLQTVNTRAVITSLQWRPVQELDLLVCNLGMSSHSSAAETARQRGAVELVRVGEQDDQGFTRLLISREKGNVVLNGTKSGALWGWDLRTPRRCLEMEAPATADLAASSVLDIHVLSDSYRAVTQRSNGELRLLDLRTMKPVVEFVPGTPRTYLPLLRCAVDKHETVVVAGACDAQRPLTVSAFALQSGRLVTSLDVASAGERTTKRPTMVQQVHLKPGRVDCRYVDLPEIWALSRNELYVCSRTSDLSD
ncbi:hypothetical protein BBJ28_00000035 [Nothophytophthora sp. Chile5]|nr:hypothetical protein BBJ28_00000035 [Nothophytophthora sp. Chile5]